MRERKQRPERETKETRKKAADALKSDIDVFLSQVDNVLHDNEVVDDMDGQ